MDRVSGLGLRGAGSTAVERTDGAQRTDAVQGEAGMMKAVGNFLTGYTHRVVFSLYVHKYFYLV